MFIAYAAVNNALIAGRIGSYNLARNNGTDNNADAGYRSNEFRRMGKADSRLIVRRKIT